MKNRVLIVDDHKDFRNMVKGFISDNVDNVEVYEAYNGEMGLAKAICLHPSVVLMDINLPHADGIMVARHIKEDCPDCSVIILTMFEVDVFRQMAKQVNAEDFIGKSEIFDRLIPTIERCMN